MFTHENSEDIKIIDFGLSKKLIRNDLMDDGDNPMYKIH